MISGLDSDWYAAFVYTGEEEKVKNYITSRFNELRCFVPKRKLRERKQGKWHDVLRPLFPGYVLINGEIDIKDYYILKEIPGLCKVLCTGKDLLPIPKWEIRPICRLVNQGEVIGLSEIEEIGGQIRVIAGPLTGFEGSIVKIDRRKGRAKVRLDFLGEARLVDLAVDIIRPL